MTPTQLQELLETDWVRSLIERAEEREFVDPVELEAFALEHELAEDDIEQPVPFLGIAAAQVDARDQVEVLLGLGDGEDVV